MHIVCEEAAHTDVCVFVGSNSQQQAAVEMFRGCESAAASQTALSESSPGRHVPWLIHCHTAIKRHTFTHTQSFFSFGFSHPTKHLAFISAANSCTDE